MPNVTQKKKFVLFTLGALILFLLFIEFSYALWELSLTQTGENVVASDCFKIAFEEKNEIHLQNAFPLDFNTLHEWAETATPYTFTVTNTCNSYAEVSINLETLNVEGKRLEDKYIGFFLKNEGDIIQQGLLELQPLNNENKVLKNSINAYSLQKIGLSEYETKEYQLLLFLEPSTKATSEVMNSKWSSKITLSSVYIPFESSLNRIRERCLLHDCNATFFQNEYVEKTTQIIIQNQINPIENAIAEYDESYFKNNSVKSYIVENEETESEKTYTIYLQANGKIIMPENSHYYFANFSQVKEIVGLENLDTRNVKNMVNMFSGLSSLTSLDLSHFDTSNVTNMEGMFSGMSSLTNLDLSNFDTSKVTDMGGMFGRMSSLTSLDLSHFDTSKVTTMGSMFLGMSSLTNLDLSNFDTRNVTDMGGMFSGMSSVTSLDVSNFDTTNVMYMGGMFRGMSSLSSIDLSNFNTSNVTNMDWMFAWMRRLTSLDISSFDTSNVTTMSHMFYLNNNLTNIVFGDEFVRKSDSIIDSMFENCPANRPTHSSWNGAFGNAEEMI